MKPMKQHWDLDPDVVFLNHGSFGACPRVVLEEQQRLRRQMEAEPVRFMVRERPLLWNRALESLAEFVGADSEGVAFVTNATTAVNAVVRSLPLRPGDELLCTSLEYNACRNILDETARERGATVRVADIPFPLSDESEITKAVLGAVTPRTRFALLDHVTSATAMILPLADILPPLKGQGILVMVDGAHALGMIPLSLNTLGADFYTGNAHKWLCAPKGSAFLWVAAEMREWVRPTTLSHGANAPTSRQSRFRWEFDWQGTTDPTPWLCIPKAIEFMGSLLPGGWTGLREHNHHLVLEGRNLLLDILGTRAPCPDHMLGSMATIPLGVPAPRLLKDHFDILPLQKDLLERFKIQVPLHASAHPPHHQWLRISAQAHNDVRDYEALGCALRELIP